MTDVRDAARAPPHRGGARLRPATPPTAPRWSAAQRGRSRPRSSARCATGATYFMARGIHAATVAAEFREHADEELRHADQIAERIVQLGGEPDFSPMTLLARSHAEYVEARRCST